MEILYSLEFDVARAVTIGSVDTAVALRRLSNPTC